MFKKTILSLIIFFSFHSYSLAATGDTVIDYSMIPVEYKLDRFETYKDEALKNLEKKDYENALKKAQEYFDFVAWNCEAYKLFKDIYAWMWEKDLESRYDRAWKACQLNQFSQEAKDYAENEDYGDDKNIFILKNYFTITSRKEVLRDSRFEGDKYYRMLLLFNIPEEIKVQFDNNDPAYYADILNQDFWAKPTFLHLYYGRFLEKWLMDVTNVPEIFKYENFVYHFFTPMPYKSSQHKAYQLLARFSTKEEDKIFYAWKDAQIWSDVEKKQKTLDEAITFYFDQALKGKDFFSMMLLMKDSIDAKLFTKIQQFSEYLSLWFDVETRPWKLLQEFREDTLLQKYISEDYLRSLIMQGILKSMDREDFSCDEFSKSLENQEIVTYFNNLKPPFLCLNEKDRITIIDLNTQTGAQMFQKLQSDSQGTRYIYFVLWGAIFFILLVITFYYKKTRKVKI